MCNEIAVFMPVNTKPTLYLLDQGANVVFKFGYLRNIFHESITSTGSNSSDMSEQGKSKAFWKDLLID
jgi:hypothetical protein